MKKLFVFLFFLIFCFSPLSSKENKFISISFDSGYLIDGLMKYGWGAGGIIEIRLLENFSFSVDAGYIEYKEDDSKLTTLNVLGTIRWYPYTGMEGFFTGIGFGTFYTILKNERVQGYMLPVEMGLKFIFFGFSIEPGLTFLPKYGNSTFFFGMKYGLNLGYTF